MFRDASAAEPATEASSGPSEVQVERPSPPEPDEREPDPLIEKLERVRNDLSVVLTETHRLMAQLDRTLQRSRELHDKWKFLDGPSSRE
jgi:hypothetical protein